MQARRQQVPFFKVFGMTHPGNDPKTFQLESVSALPISVVEMV